MLHDQIQLLEKEPIMRVYTDRRYNKPGWLRALWHTFLFFFLLIVGLFLLFAIIAAVI